MGKTMMLIWSPDERIVMDGDQTFEEWLNENELPTPTALEEYYAVQVYFVNIRFRKDVGYAIDPEFAYDFKCNPIIVFYFFCAQLLRPGRFLAIAHHFRRTVSGNGQ